jgi:Phage major capsid protein E
MTEKRRKKSMPTQTAKQLIGKINEAIPDIRSQSRLHYVNKLSEMRVGPGTPSWLLRVGNLGLAPLVSEMQNSPVVGQGTYRQYEANAVITKHQKIFTKDELSKLLSPDKNFRLPMEDHIALELVDSVKRVYETMEFVAHEAFVKGALRYVLIDSLSNVSVDMAFPVKQLGYADLPTNVAWSDTTNAKVVTDLKWALENFRSRTGRYPDSIRMNMNMWYDIRDNAEVKLVYASYLRTTGAKAADIEKGIITPDFIVKALDVPPFDIYDEMTFVSYPCKNNEAEGATVVVELPGTWGLRIGDKLLCKYAIDSKGFDDWNFEATITALDPGKSVTITIPTGKTLTAGDVLACWTRFMPNYYLQFVLNESDDQWISTPFGIDFAGSQIQAMHLYGPRVDMFNLGREPLAGPIGRRVWHEFGLMFNNPNNHMSIKTR